MSLSAIQRGVDAYLQWKGRVVRAIGELDAWLAEDVAATTESATEIQAALTTLEADRPTLVIVTGDGANAAALINALFLPGYQQMLIPNEIAWPPPCPISFLWDETRKESYLRLLPIETRSQDKSLAELAANDRQWVHYPLSSHAPEAQAGTLLEIAQTKAVKPIEAARLGLAAPATSSHEPWQAGSGPIPKWRHALVSLPHPLLKKGLMMLVTPGLAALDQEPEIAAQIRAQAQVALFVLGAERGVTPASLEIWQRHLKGFQSGRQQSLIAVLDDGDEAPGQSPARPGRPLDRSAQLAAASAVLGLERERIVRISARRGLTARMQGDHAMLRQSALPTLEQVLSARILEAKHQALVELLDQGVGDIVKQHRARISAELARAQAHLRDLESLYAKSEKVIGQLIAQTREEREHYLESVVRFQAERDRLITETRLCQELLARRNIDAIVVEAHRRMVKSWTTRGLGQAMQGLIDVLRARMQAIVDESERLRRLVRTAYQGFRDDHGFELGTPKVFAPTRYHVELELLYREAELFRHSSTMIFSEKAHVIERFHQQIVSRARVLFDQLRTSFDPWLRDALQPVVDAIDAHKGAMERRLESLQQIGSSSTGLKQRIQALQTEHLELTKKLTALRNIQNTLYHAPLPHDARERPALVVEHR